MSKTNPLAKLRRHLAACVQLLDEIKPAPDADDRTRQEWVAIRDAVERAVLAAKNVRKENQKHEYKRSDPGA